MIMELLVEKCNFLVMDGCLVFKWVVRMIIEVVIEVLGKVYLEFEDILLVVFY